MRHLLKKQVLDLKVSLSLDAFAVQHNMSAHYWKYILPILGKIFDELGDSERVMKIDSLEIDLGTFSRQHVEQAAWNATFIAELEQKLRSAMQLVLKQKEDKGETREMVVFNQWLYYMKNGFLPWNSAGFKEGTTTVLETLATEYASISALRQLLLSGNVARNRIIFQHGEIFLQNLVTVLTSKNQEGLYQFVDKVSRAQSMTGKQAGAITGLPLYRIKNNIWQYILSTAARYQHLTSDEIRQRVLLKYAANTTTGTDTDIKQLSNKLPTPDIVKPTTGLSPGNNDPASNETEKSSESLYKAGDTNGSNEKEAVQPDAGEAIPPTLSSLVENFKTDEDNPAAEDSGTQENLQNDSSELEEGVFINLAGLVLVHPFLPTLFRKLNWVVNSKFNNPDDQQRALYLLHYIGTGSIKAEEYDLVSAKTLCAYPLQMPVAKDITIDEEAIYEADNMLEALIAQWDILKQTSADGLRQGFLQREGKLYTRNERLYLQVESKGIDVLLDRVPWNLSIIKLPWMKNIMTIEWR